MSYQVILSSDAKKDQKKLKAANPSLSRNAKELVDVIGADPYANPPSYEKLLGKLKGQYSRRINYQHRFIYTVDEENKIVHVLSMWSHYE